MVVDQEDSVLRFDMRFHAFVLAMPRGQRVPGLDSVRLGEPVIAMNGGDDEALVFALRAIADGIEAGTWR